MDPKLEETLKHTNRRVNRKYYSRRLRLVLKNRISPVVKFFHACLDAIHTRKRNAASALRKYDRMAGDYIAYINKAYEQPFEVLANLNGNPVLVRSDHYYDMVKEYVMENVFHLKEDAQSYLEVGAGEYTTMVLALNESQVRPRRLVGLDISWSRLYVGEQHAKSKGIQIERSVAGDLFNLPFLDDSFDIVYTHPCIEQSSTDNRQALSELYRVAKNYLVLIEPSYELGDRIQQKRILSQDYVRGLPKAIRKLGYHLIKYEILPIGAYANRPAVFIIEKNKSHSGELNPEYLACPISKEPLIFEKQHLYCKKLGLIYPIIHGVACLDKSHAVRGWKFIG